MMTATPLPSISRRAFTLIEVVIAVIVLAIAVPPTLNLLDSAGAGRADAINTSRATYLATTVLESVMADLTSTQETLGFDALGDESAYLNTPVTGLYARLEGIVEPYTRMGLTYSVGISELVSSDATVSDDIDENVFRIVTVRVSFPSATSAAYTMPVSMMVTQL